MLPIGKFLEPNYGKLVAFIGLMIIVFYLAFPNLSTSCYYGTECKRSDFACVSSAYEALSVCERTKTLYSIGFSALAYIIACSFFLGYKLLGNEAYSYYYEQN
ncbi:MAG TPA: hypothetical protein VJI13_03580 [Candidatus Norongarragalinales archaeon]|nr:hypothetical protein [Candidatus Norongarragalinales archaeon]